MLVHRVTYWFHPRSRIHEPALSQKKKGEKVNDNDTETILSAFPDKTALKAHQDSK